VRTFERTKVAALTTRDDMTQGRSWTCFHCDETFTTAEEAAEHFGDSPEEKPACLLGPERKALLTALRKSEGRARRLAHENEVLEYQVGSVEFAWRRFGGARSEHEAFCAYDSMEGRALAAEAIVADMAARLPALVEASRRRVCGGLGKRVA
jgi:hypothetical protein